MPRLWNDTVSEHRRSAREATLDATAALVAEHGLGALTMSQIAEAAGIGRATLYRYFADVESVLVAWHERQVSGHVDQLAAIRDAAGTPGERLEAALTAYARISQHGHHGSEMSALLHRGDHVLQAHRRLRSLVRDLLADAVRSGDVRADVPAEELAGYCLHALGAAATLRAQAAVRRLVRVTLAGLRPVG